MRRRLVLLLIASQQLHVALLLLPRPPRLRRHQLAPDQLLQHRLHLRERIEAVHTVGACLQLARGLRAAEHQHGQQGGLAG